ncbi:hypothetical protein NQ315_009837 [Exocentrus adspersus]|uniref:Optineurin n=1 Tax=Exocentrus adspersus TaxID=1586481 RepID=A0AAV8WHC9_9CUCU|nr:hypothetical protein NQ315_009837 [Exocentrus adspersus]
MLKADMASNACSSSTETFKVPSEPGPLPSLGSDEESFVVLWKDVDSKSIVELGHEPIVTNIVEEAKQLIEKELSEIDKASLIVKTDAGTPLNDSPANTVEKPTVSVQELQMAQTENDVSDQNNLETSCNSQSAVFPKMPHVETGFDTPGIISVTTLSTDLTADEVQKKIKEIVEENIQLKDTILQNNMSMKLQYDRIVAWQKDVKQVHDAHKNKLLEAKELVEKLQKESGRLKLELEQLTATKNSQEAEIVALKQALSDRRQVSEEKQHQTVEVNTKSLELEEANRKMKDLQQSMERMTLENNKLKNDKAESDAANKKLKETEQAIMMSLRPALEAAKKEIKELRDELAQAKLQEDEKLKMKDDEIVSLRSQLTQAVHQCNMQPSHSEVITIREQLAKTQIMLTQVEHSRAAAHGQIEDMQNEITELKAKLDGSRAHADEIYALKEQLNVFKADFEAERNAKDTIKQEKERLTEDMQNLQRRNQQLQEEINILRENSDYVVPPSQMRETRASAPSAPSSSSLAPHDHPFKCPVCSFGFRSHTSLENHVYKCLELNDRLP